MDTNPHLRALLLENARITPDVLSEIEQRPDQCHVVERLVASGYIDESELAGALAQRTGRPRVSLDEAAPEERAVAFVSGPVCARFLVVPIEISSSSKGPHLVLAMSDPLDVEAIRAVHAEAEMRISPLVASASEVRRAIERTYGLPSPIPAPASAVTLPTSGEDESDEGVTIRPQVFENLFDEMEDGADEMIHALRSAQSDEECAVTLRGLVRQASSERDRLLFGLASVLVESGAISGLALAGVLSDEHDDTSDQGGDP